MYSPVSILDTDLYKLTMQQAIVQLYPNEYVTYKFINRGLTKFTFGLAELIRRRINMFAGLALTKQEKLFLKDSCYYLSPAYLDFLEGYRFDPNEVIIDWANNNLEIEISGPWYRTILWEVPLMALISETYYEHSKIETEWDFSKRAKYVRQKASALAKLNCKYSEFGTRRRYSLSNQEEVITTIIQSEHKKNLLGTSNPYLAMKHNLKVLGTQAHEWYMFHGAKYGYRMANHIGMEKWVDVYQGNLGIDLTDTYTTSVFFRDFGTKYSKLYDGLRHDSGDPRKFIDKAIYHYNQQHIDPNQKILMFSDSLNLKDIKLIKKWLELHHYTGPDRYGIGTWLTNDLKGVTPLNMVIKLSGVFVNNEWVPAVKLSDVSGKNTGESEEVQLCKQTLRIKGE